MNKVSILFLIFVTFCSINLFAAKNLYLSYTKTPTNIYKNQKFEIKIEAMITTSNFTNISTKFVNSSNIEVLNTNFSLPLFEISLLNSNELIDQSTLEPLQLKISNIGKADDRYSNIVAENIILKAYKTKQYNNDNALTIIDLDAVNSNLSDFSLKNIEEQGVSSIKEWENIENLVYYFVTPIFQKNLIFTYFNTTTNSFKEVKVPLILQNELVSTQTDLNPNDSTFEKYKKIAAIIVFVIFLLIYIWKRWKIVLFFTFISLIVAIIYNLPNQKSVIKTDSYIYILPTKNSTVFFKTQKDERVEALEKRENFVKVLGVDSDFIGWVKEESFEKN